MAPWEAPISASLEQREMWHTLLLLFLGTEADTVSLIQVTVDEVSKLLKTPEGRNDVFEKMSWRLGSISYIFY